MAEEKYRFVTRDDFDGVVCGTLLSELEMIDGIKFAEPGDMQAGKVAVSERDITANLPYRDEVHLCFDHHLSEVERVGERRNLIIDPEAPSAARVIYTHFGGKQKFPKISDELMAAVDQADSAQYTMEDIMAPSHWTLLNFLIDPRTGLDRPGKFTTPRDQLMIDLMTYCRHNPIDEILQLPDILERVAAYSWDSEFAERQFNRCSRVDGKVVITDLRDEDEIVPVNRFLVYALYPQCNVSIRIARRDDGRIHVSAGKSVLDRSSEANIGSLMLASGDGGGHMAAGTCRVDDSRVDEVVAKLTMDLNAAN